MVLRTSAPVQVPATSRVSELAKTITDPSTLDTARRSEYSGKSSMPTERLSERGEAPELRSARDNSVTFEGIDRPAAPLESAAHEVYDGHDGADGPDASTSSSLLPHHAPPGPPQFSLSRSRDMLRPIGAARGSLCVLAQSLSTLSERGKAVLSDRRKSSHQMMVCPDARGGPLPALCHGPARFASHGHRLSAVPSAAPQVRTEQCCRSVTLKNSFPAFSAPQLQLGASHRHVPTRSRGSAAITHAL